MYYPEVHDSLLHLPGEASIPRYLPGRKPSCHGHIGIAGPSVTATLKKTAPHRCRSRRMILIRASSDDSASDEPVNGTSPPNGITSQQQNHGGFRICQLFSSGAEEVVGSACPVRVTGLDL